MRREDSRNSVVRRQINGRLGAVEGVVRQRLRQDELEDFLSVTPLFIVVMVVVIIRVLDVVKVQAVDRGILGQLGEGFILVIVIVVVAMVAAVMGLGNTVVLGSEEGERTSAVVEDGLGGRNQVDQLDNLGVLFGILVEELPDGQLGVVGLGVADPLRSLGIGVGGGATDRVVDGLPFREAEFGNVLGLLSPGQSLCRQWQEQE